MTQVWSERMDIPAQLLPGASHLEIVGNRQAVIEGVKSVLAYESTGIKLHLGSLALSFEGSDLLIRSYQQQQVILSGVIAALHFTSAP
ncbi:MAG: YabP/YqfC family sporulation protein [Oscillospiraceae bacterium]|nr:YabP/YqfC family sporulation protein [Oscillospiraceae bacterium]